MSFRPKVISTFSGCGGSSLGYKMAGCEVLVAVEWDGNAVATYRRNHPATAVVHGDISLLSIDKCLELAGLKEGQLDILDGSPPCQGFSMAGARKVADERNYLFKEYVRLLRGLKPKVFIMENVPGMVVGKMKWIFAEIMRELKESDYRVRAKVMNAQYYGVPQQRKRLIFIGVRKDLGLTPTFPLPQTMPIPLGRALKGLPVDPSTDIKKAQYLLWRRVRPGESFAKAHYKGSYFNSIKVSPAKPCPTITKTPRQLYHWRYPRPLNVAELKRAASYRDDYEFIGSDSQAWERIGNSVPPLFMKAIAEHVINNILKVEAVA